jgi:hypothetical protein
MKAAERDAHLAQQTADISRIAAAVEMPERRRRAEGATAGFPPMRLLFGGEKGAVALLRGIPGFAGLWDRVVPDRAILRTEDRERQVWRIVLCECGEQVALRSGALGDCACGRWFFATGDSVRVKHFRGHA